ncbi:MAG TPA: DUF3298 domain-containing protein [Bacteroidales bacterium]
MKKIILLALLGIGLLNSCQEKNTNKNTGEFPITYEKKHVFVKDETCKDELEKCTRVDVEYYEFAEPRGYIANLQTSQMIEFISGLPISDSVVPAELTANALLERYTGFINDFPDSKQYWSVSMKSQITYKSDKLLSIEMLTGSYLGGAHGDFRRSFLTIDSEGNRVHVIDFISDVKKFAELAEKKFRKLEGLKKDQHLNSTGYFFPDGKFILPEGIGLNEEGFVLYYNVYEIAPFYIGGTEIILSFDELEGIIKKPFFQ